MPHSDSSRDHGRPWLAVAALIVGAAPLDGAAIPIGPGRFVHHAGDRGDMPVWTYRSADAGEDPPVLFVMHGTRRNASNYRDAWIEHARRLGVLLVTPEFSKAAWPASWAYQQIGVTDAEDRLTDSTTWASQRIEDLFDEVKQANDLSAEGYYLYGHSAGGQFVHRMMLLTPKRRVLLAMPANPGWYTLPALQKPYPEGLGGTRADNAWLRTVLQSEVVLLLGEEDNDPNGRNLPSGAAAKRQGPHRFARGQLFYRLLQDQAEALAVDLGWRVRVVPGVGHSNTDMAPYAADVIAEHLRTVRRRSPANPRSDPSDLPAR